MSSLPWEPDRPLSAEMARSAIRSAFPSVDVGQVRHLGSGWEFDVFSTSDGWAFRFPRRVEYEALFDHERPVLAVARSALPPEITVPLVELLGRPAHGFPYCIAGHRLIEGVPADSVGSELRGEAARSIGLALGAIHSVSLSLARDAGVREPGGDEDGPQHEGARKWLQRNLAGAAQLTGRDPTIGRAVAWAMELYNPLCVMEAPRCFTHDDLSPDHLLVHPSTGRLTGILDWTDACLGDPARDFVTPATFGGWSFVEEILSHYPRAVDSGFRERLRFMARFLSVMWLGEAQQNDGDVDRHLLWVLNAFTGESAS